MTQKSWKRLQAEAAKQLGKGEVGRAAHLLVEAIELAPQEARLYEQLVHAALGAGGIETAVKAAVELVKLNPHNAHYAYLRAVAAMAQGDTDTAERVLEEALDSSPTSAEIRQALAQIARLKAEPDRALTLLADAVRHAPTASSIVSDYAGLLLELHRYAQAREVLAPAAGANPADAGLQLAMAKACANLGEVKTARVHAVRAKDTDDAEVHAQAVRLVAEIDSR